jgi:hypothetical protein
MLSLAGSGVLLRGWLEVLFIVASVALASGRLCWGFRRHGRWRVFIVLGAALTMIGVRRFLAGEPYKMVCVVVGAVVLAGGHLVNRYLCLTCVVCEHEPGSRGS